MAKKNITFGGISRITDLLSAQSGDCTEMINARIKDGSIVPSCPVQMKAEIVGDVHKAVWHPAAGKWICIFAEGIVSVLNEDYSAYDTDAISALSGYKVSDAGVVGNTVVLATDKGMRYVLWKDKAYKWLGGLPRLDNSNMVVRSEVEIYSATDEKDVFSMDDKNDINFVHGNLICPYMHGDNGLARYDVDPKKNTIYYNGLSTFDEKAAGYISKAVESIHNNHAYIDAAIFQVALRLFDDSLVAVSPIITLYCPDGYKFSLKNINVSKGAGNFAVSWHEGKEISVAAIGFKPTFLFDLLDLSDWKDIVTEICLFTSGSIPFFELSKKERVTDDATGYEYWRPCVQSYGTFGGYSFMTFGDILKATATCFERGVTPPGDEAGLWLNKVYLRAQYTDGKLSGFNESTEANHDWFEVESNSLYFNQLDMSFPYGLMYTDAYRKKLEEVSSLHLCAVYNISGEKTWEIDNVGSTELALQKSMIAEGAISELADGNMHIYNQRVHMWGAKEVFPDDIINRLSFTTNSFNFINEDNLKPAYTILLDAYVYIALDGQQIVKKYENILVNTNCFVDGLISYPDTRAEKVLVVVKKITNNYPESSGEDGYKEGDLYTGSDSEGNTITIQTFEKLFDKTYTLADIEIDYAADGDYYPAKTFVLTPSSMLNYSYCRIKAEDMDINGAATGVYDDNRKVVSMKSWDVILKDNLPTNVSEDYTPLGNLLKISNAGNPFYFAGKNEVAVGNEKIMGLTANTVTLSQGQFGEQPLYVFCEDGIYVLSVDTSGEIAYRACNPVAEDVADNKGSIATAGGGVIYADARGIKMRIGEDVEVLSNNINGLVGEEIAASKSLRELATSVGLSDIAQHPTRFEEYIHGAVATFHIKEDEIIVSNPDYDYSYIYNIPSKAWSKIVGSWCGKVDRPARCIMFDKVKKYVEDDNGIMDLSWVSRIFEFTQGNAADGKILIVTRPQALGSTGYKRVMQLALRGWIDGKEQKLGCYLLGSNDGLHFSIINGKEISSMCRDITTDIFPSKAYRWVMLAIGGTSGEKTSISMAELNIIEANDNKL